MQDDNATQATVAYNNMQLETTAYPILPLRNTIVCPHLIVSLVIGRENSINTVQQNRNKSLLFILQDDPKLEQPTAEEFKKVGTIAKILHVRQLADKSLKITVAGQHLVHLDSIDEQMMAHVSIMPQVVDIDTVSVQRIVLTDFFTQYLKLKKQYTTELISMLTDIEDPFIFIDFIAIHSELDYIRHQQILEESSLSKRFDLIVQALAAETESIKLSNQISQDVKEQFEAYHKKAVLTAKYEAIKKALDKMDGESSDLDSLAKLIQDTKLSPEAKEKAQREFSKLKNMSPMSSEAALTRNYLDWLLALPWGKTRKPKFDLAKAKLELNKNHFGLEKVKKRIYEAIAVEKRVGTAKSPILCLYGPPGVGKTSLARSIADATSREFISISLGGLSDEAELRGHRSTYIGAKPGKIIQGMRRAESDNPVFLLDEIGEIGQDPRGNPAAALLEILDPEHRNEFRDNFLEVSWPFDRAMIITSTNRLDTLPPALVDRMEIINLSGYTTEEKIHICKNHLIPKQIRAHGLTAKELTVTDDAIVAMIQNYTREAGVRNLERAIAQICRKIVVLNEPSKRNKKTNISTDITQHNRKGSLHTVTAVNLDEYLGAPYYTMDDQDRSDKIGVSSGLAWTSVGGEILYIEASIMPDGDKIIITGKLGQVMSESVQTACTVAKIKSGLVDLSKKTIHVHVPEGATPKDGPSAGVAICLAVLSALTGRKIRGDVAITGEISLQGRVLKIGGLKEKLLAAQANNIKTVLIPKQNEYELAEIRSEVDISKLQIVPITHIDQAIELMYAI